METRFSFNPKNKTFIIANDFQAHSESIAKFYKGEKYYFDDFIRGILKENVLYFRMFYNLPDIEEKTGEEIKEYSFNYIFDNLPEIKKAIKNAGLPQVKKVLYNVLNADLKGILINI